MPTREWDFTQKLRWAERHLEHLEALVADYRATNPYVVRRHLEGKRNKRRWRMHITAAPPDEIALVLGDFLYNVRATLDYLVALLVPAEQRSRSFFPILKEHIWNIPLVEGENKERADARKRWRFIEEYVSPEAVALLKTMQPPEGRPDPRRPMHNLLVLNALSNKDRHRKLHILAPGLDGASARIWFTYRDGTTEEMVAEPPVPDWGFTWAFKDGTPFRFPTGVGPGDVVDVKVEGSVEVVVEVSPEWTHVVIPAAMRGIWESATYTVGALEPLLRWGG